MSRTDLIGDVADRFAWFADDQPDKPFVIVPRNLIAPMRAIYGDAVDYVEQQTCEK